MAKIRKNVSLNKDYHLTAEYFNKMTNYVRSDERMYDDLEKNVYDTISKNAQNGIFSFAYPMKINFDKSFEWNEKYKDLFKKLKLTLYKRGFKITMYGNYIGISWK